MRFGWLLPPAGAVEQAAAAEEQGYDVAWLEDSGTLSPTAVAASLAVGTSAIRVGVTAVVGNDHPVELAEEVAIADLALGGRLLLAVRSAATTVGDVPEILDLLLDCFATHPFRHPGPTWPTPANLEQNVFNLEKRIRVSPAPAQFELPLWVAGPLGRDAAVERGLGFVADADEPSETLASWWAEAAARHALLIRRVRRSTFWNPPMRGRRVDVAVAVEQLRTLQHSIGLDLVVVRPPESGQDQRVMTDITRLVRPRVQLDRLPPGLDEHWADHEHPDPVGEQNG